MAELKVKAWLEVNGRFALGPGTARLLREVREKGSIAGAAAATSMSYRHAWGLIRGIERSTGLKIVETRRGGPSGGGTLLTGEGLALLREFENRNGALHAYVAGGMNVPFLAVDGIILVEGEVVLVRRKYPPYEGMHALPGGMVESGERVEDAVRREMSEETGLETEPARLVGVYSDPDRDPRGHTVSVVYEMEVVGGKLRAGDDAEDVGVFPLDRLPKLAFDHAAILRDFTTSRQP